MSASKKTKSKQSTPKNLKNRIPKILGLSFILLASFLFVAFISYLFTWQADQDKVLRFSWGLLFEDNVTAENFLGRFGAIVSNMFFYWGIGLASFVIVYLFAWAGVHLLKDKKPKRPITVLKNSFFIILFSTIYLEFIFSSSSFPWGGAFGQGTVSWLQSFLGTIGVVILLLFVLIGLVIWFFNPDL
ncbi:MAG TPA: DNA translocase FtsK 4TM domain-containing protein, partial [Saprospiraceae bacterium]|nr:DNA translocase FtsK 4TM domain-containing protein [Saprospiraceae bacterium]